MEDSFPFPFEPLLTVPAALPPKRMGNTSSDTGVNSPHILSTAFPITPDNSHNRQFYLMHQHYKWIFFRIHLSDR